MKILNKTAVAIALAVTCTIGILPPVIAAGKVENATVAQVKEAAEAALASTQQALAGVKSGANKDIIIQHITSARQDSKGIEVGRLDVKRNKGMGKLKDARVALENDDKEKAESSLNEAVNLYQDIKNSL